MYPRAGYVGGLSLAVGGLVLAASLGDEPVAWAAYAVALVLGGLAFYQGEARVTPGPIVANVGVALAGGALVALVTVAALFVVVIEAPWDLALWQGGLRLWSDTVGIGFAFTTAFFIVGAVTSLR